MAAWMYIGSTWSYFSFSSSAAAAAAAGPRGGGGRARFLCWGSRRDEVRGSQGQSRREQSTGEYESDGTGG